MSITTNEPIYFAWEDYDKKTPAWKKLDYFIDCYVEKYGVYPTLAMVSPEDYDDLRQAVSGTEDSYNSVRLMSRRYIPWGVFRLALPEEEL